MIESDKTLTIEEFAEKCKIYLPKRFFRDIFVPAELKNIYNYLFINLFRLRTSVYRYYDNLKLVDREEEENKTDKHLKDIK